MLSCEPDKDAALAELADALVVLAALADALAALADAEPPEEEQPANRALPARAALVIPANLRTSRLEYVRMDVDSFMLFPRF